MMLVQLDMHKQKQKKNSDPYLTPYTKINSKWVIDLNLRVKTESSIRKHRRNLCELGFGKDMTPKAQSIKGKNINRTS